MPSTKRVLSWGPKFQMSIRDLSLDFGFERHRALCIPQLNLRIVCRADKGEKETEVLEDDQRGPYSCYKQKRHEPSLQRERERELYLAGDRRLWLGQGVSMRHR